MEKEDVPNSPGSPRDKKHTKMTMIAMHILWRLKIAFLAILISIGLFFQAIVVWAVGLIQAGVSFGIHSGPLFKAAGDLFNCIFLTPVRLVVAIAFIFGIPRKWLETVLTSIVPFTRKPTPWSRMTTGADSSENIDSYYIDIRGHESAESIIELLNLADKSTQGIAGISVCPNCHMKVLPDANGTCPNCQTRIPS